MKMYNFGSEGGRVQPRVAILFISLRVIGKFGPKLKSSRRSWKVRAEVGKLGLKLESDF